jgi:hypothetical protein
VLHAQGRFVAAADDEHPASGRDEPDRHGHMAAGRFGGLREFKRLRHAAI